MSAATDLEEGREQRLLWMARHVPKCRDCRYATKMKGYEHQVAMRIGPGAMEDFFNGKSVLGYAGASVAISELLNAKLLTGEIDRSFITWMAEMSKRNGKDFEDG